MGPRNQSNSPLEEDHVIRQITSDGTVTTVVGSLGSAGVILGALPGSLNAPSGLALLPGPVTSLVISDRVENAVLRADLP